MANEKVNKKVLVKSVSAVILVCVIAAAIIGLGLLFGLFKYSDIIGKILLSLLTIVLAGLLLLNSINAITMGNKVGVFAAYLIIISVIMIFILIWIGNIGEIFKYIVVIVSAVSILLNRIVGHYILMKKSLILVQLFFYLNLAYVELVISLAILGNSILLVDFLQIFIATIIIATTLDIILIVKEKNIAQKETETKVNVNGEEFVTITKVEYEELKAAAARLKELTEKENTPANDNNI